MTKIQARREAAKISRSELSRLAGVPLRTIESWEYEQNIPRDVYQLGKIAKVLRCLIEDLVDLET